MSRVAPFANHLAPDSVCRLERAAERRYEDAVRLLAEPRHHLAALYLFGYCAEMCLSAPFFRGAGFHVNAPIGRDMRQRRMAQARQLRTPTGQPLMNSDAHPLVGWARFLNWQRSASSELTDQEGQRLHEAINKAELIYKHWRPELRYKTSDVMLEQLAEARKAASWFIENRGLL